MKPRITVFLGVFTAILACLAASAARGQGILSSNWEIVGATGDAIPGSGLTLGLPTGLDRPAIQDDGHVLFLAQVFPTSSEKALCYGENLADLIILARYGQPEPSGTVPGATLSFVPSSYTLSSDGYMIFGSQLTGAGITLANDSVLYAGTPGSLQVVAREGDQAADSPAGTTYEAAGSVFGAISMGLSTCAAHRVAFESALAGALTSSKALFTGTPGALTRVMTQGEVVPQGTIGNFADVVQMSASGQLLIDSLAYAGGGPNNHAVWLYTPGIGKQEILREGDPTPIMDATFGSTITSGSNARNQFNAMGQALLSTSLVSSVPGVVTFGVNDSAIFLVSAGGQSLVARKGDPAPGILNATLSLIINPNLRLNDNGVIVFGSSMAGPGVTPNDNSAIWIGTPGNFTVVARQGDVAPGTGGSIMGPLWGNETFLNNADQLVFAVSLAGGGSPGTALMAWDPVSGLQPFALQGDVIEVKPGNFQPLDGFFFTSPQMNGGSRSLCFADDGTFTFQAKFGLIGAEVKTRLGSMTGIPRTISEAAGGTHRMSLNAGSAHAGEAYIVAGSLSGTVPGLQLGPLHLPLNFDAYTLLMLTNLNVPPFSNTAGVLDSQGRATASITIPPSVTGLAGLTTNHAFATINGNGDISSISEASELTIVP